MKKKILSILTLCIIASACDNNEMSLPGYVVHLEINILGEYPNFVLDNGIQYLTFTEPKLATDRLGCGGILIVIYDRAYHAYDLACPREANKNVIVAIDGLFAVCPKCGEAYDIYGGFGAPTKGINKLPLQRYNCYYLSNGILRITN